MGAHLFYQCYLVINLSVIYQFLHLVCCLFVCLFVNFHCLIEPWGGNMIKRKVKSRISRSAWKTLNGLEPENLVW